MITLVLTLCLAGNPATCERRRLPFEGPLLSCFYLGEHAAAEYLASRPKWRLQRWRCEPPRAGRGA